ncbi:hypothetical protein [Dokdonia sp.]|uniref:hypothetical protein n=1 Tax=Dokdonia sp. TaxID=2024995 RepID=UPI00326793FD
MNTEDDDIKAFFADMRKEDTQHTIPKFEDLLPKKRTSKIRYIIPIGIAASLIVGFGVWTDTTETRTIPDDTLFISLEEETGTETLLSDDLSVFSWESPTASLINDFND